MKIAIIILLFIIFIPSFASSKVKVNCSFEYSDDQYNYDGKYLVIRNGDSLYAEYRHLPADEMERTDDVTFQYYSGDELDSYNESGFVDFLCETSDTNCRYLRSISYFGVKQVDEEKFEMQLWKLEGIFGLDLVSIASPGSFFSTCKD